MHLAELQAAGRIAILGAGREGQAAYAWLHERLPQRALTLLAESPAEPQFLARMDPADRFVQQPFSTADLCAFDLLIRSPGISLYRQPLREAAAAGVRITTPSNLWFAAHPRARSICITGTKGKSTTAALVAHLLRSCGCRVQLAGNIGLPLLACDDDEADWWVIELSSYQIADLEAEPTIAVILNLSPEHLDWHGSEDTYCRDKLRLAELVAHGTLILNAADAELAQRFAAARATWFNQPAGIHAVGSRLMLGDQELPVSMPASLPGRHNLANVAAALSAIHAAGADVCQAAGAVSAFQSLPHRLQVLGQRAGVSYINDSIASTPVATVAALEALQDRPVVLIVGGLDRGIDWSRYAADFRARPPRAVIGLPDNGPRIVATLRAGGCAPVRGFHQVPDLQAAVALAGELAAPGDSVLLSPGAPSFPRFVDFRDRGQAFARLCGFAPVAE